MTYEEVCSAVKSDKLFRQWNMTKPGTVAFDPITDMIVLAVAVMDGKLIEITIVDGVMCIDEFTDMDLYT